MGAWGDAWDFIKGGGVAGVGYDYLKGQTGEGGLLGDPRGTQARLGQGAASGRFADRSQDRYGYLGSQLDDEAQRMRRLASGEDSLSALKLQQAMGQNISGQQAMAASARPGSGAMAARTGAMNASRLSAGLAGQQAVAGIQERQAAQSALNQMLMQQRQQELSASLGGRSTAVNAYNPNGASGADKQMGAIEGVIQTGATLI